MVIASGIDHLANQLFLRLVRGMALQALGAAAERGDRTLAHVVGIERGDQRQTAAFLLRAGFVGRSWGHHRARGAAGAAADLARTFILIGGVGGDTGRAGGGTACGAGVAGRRSGGWGGGRRGLGLGFAKPLLGFELGLALGFLFLPVALFLGLATGFGGLAFGLLDAFAAGAALGFLFRQPALFDIADTGVGQRAGARGTLILGQRAQHHARSGVARRGGAAGRPIGALAPAAQPWARPVRAHASPLRARRRRRGACRASRPRPAWSGHG